MKLLRAAQCLVSTAQVLVLFTQPMSYSRKKLPLVPLASSACSGRKHSHHLLNALCGNGLLTLARERYSTRDNVLDLSTIEHMLRQLVDLSLSDLLSLRRFTDCGEEVGPHCFSTGLIELWVVEGEVNTA
jgi:hypothetical protein